jgi:hypothetical protein
MWSRSSGFFSHRLRVNSQYEAENILTSAAAGWTVVGTGDFTGNGTSDILLQSGGTVVGVGDEERGLPERQHIDDKRERLAGRQMIRVERL